MKEENEEEREEPVLEPEFEGKTLDQAYDLVSGLVARGSSFRCDLLKRDLWVAGKRIVKDGEFVGKVEPLETGDALAGVEYLYERYKHSIPSESTERRKRNGTQFHALDFDELSDDDIMYGERRALAKAKLETFVLFTVLSGQLKWTEGMGSWFWRSAKDPDLVLLKGWIANGNEAK